MNQGKTQQPWQPPVRMLACQDYIIKGVKILNVEGCKDDSAKK